MKLLTRTTLYFLAAMVPLLAVGGYLLFYQFSNEINKRVDRELVSEEVQWIRYLQTATAGGSRFILRSPDILIYPVVDNPTLYPQITTTFDKRENDNQQVSFRQLRHVVSVRGVPYQIIIRKSQEQKSALVANVTWIMLIVFMGLFAVMMLFNWLISRKVWQPFRETLQKIRTMELGKMPAVHFDRTATEEFTELNASLNSMTQKIYSDYRSMKEFTENAAHEMQTPLAVAQSKLELLLQDESLGEPQIQTIAQASMALNRLSKLNQSLLLLARIENNQYVAREPVSMAEITRKYLRLFEEIIQDKGLHVHTEFWDNFFIWVHPFLADSLVSNLLGNAIKYNYAGGEIQVSITEKEYCIANTSRLPAIEPEQLFKRFHTAGDTGEPSTGLGLAIVKRIAENHHLQVVYGKEGETHRFCLTKTQDNV
ncbi:MAG TPA: HAMP domain-containing sensor histidine kinase [Flavisolibacter sp.]|jgi:signal transduction histidine kinase|nr:HAMP domain-containing sensor histidine kinase [Flavisolibacter sp.]